MIINEVAESKELNKKTEEIRDYEEVAEVIKQQEYVIKRKKKRIISIIKERFFKYLRRKTCKSIRDSQKHYHF